jgi:hypothetical protein
MTIYRVQVTGHIEADGEELAVTLVREILGDDFLLDLAAQGLNLEVVATEVSEEKENV